VQRFETICRPWDGGFSGSAAGFWMFRVLKFLTLRFWRETDEIMRGKKKKNNSASNALAPTPTPCLKMDGFWTLRVPGAEGATVVLRIADIADARVRSDLRSMGW
jgi:hypothetical protein